MAKRKRAPARRGCTILRPPVQTAQQTRSARSRRPTYTPELLAQARYDFEHTDRPKRASRSISGWRDPHSGILQEAKAGSVLCRRHAACHLPCGCGARSKSLRPRRKRPLDRSKTCRVRCRRSATRSNVSTARCSQNWPSKTCALSSSASRKGRRMPSAPCGLSPA